MDNRSEYISRLIQYSSDGSLTKSYFMALGLGVVTVVYIVSRVVYLLYLHPLAKVPGPLLARMTSLWQTYYVACLVKAAKVQGIASSPAVTHVQR